MELKHFIVLFGQDLIPASFEPSLGRSRPRRFYLKPMSSIATNSI